MTEGGSGGTPLTPDEQAVARLLAEAGGPLQMPPSVSSRLDAVLEELQAERAAGAAGPTADVVELRARRRWPRVLLAAAAVVVGGYAVGTVASQGTLGGSDGADTAASDAGGGSESEASPLEAPAGGSAPEAAEERARLMIGVVRLRSDRLEAGALRALRALDSAPAALSHGGTDRRCPPPDLGAGERSLRVRYDGTAAVLVAGPERGGTVEVTVLDCSGAELDGTLVRP